MKSYFVTAAGTGVGKTYVTALIVRQLRAQGHAVNVLKPVISGFDPQNTQTSDSGILLEAAGLAISESTLQSISPWQLRDPISPDMAAENENRRIDFGELAAFCRRSRKADYILIEGAGGVMSPINEKHTVLDWMAELGYGALLVSGSYLGALSHTLTAYEALQSRNLPICSIIISESDPSPVPPERTLLTLKHFLPNDLPVYLLRRNERVISLTHILS